MALGPTGVPGPGLGGHLDRVPRAAQWRSVGQVQVADRVDGHVVEDGSGGDVDPLGDLGVAVPEQLQAQQRPGGAVAGNADRDAVAAGVIGLVVIGLRCDRDLHALERAGVITRRRSEGDRRRTYLQLVPATLDSLAVPPGRAARRVLFVCTANSARSHLAAALWRRASTVPAVSAGTHPAARIDPGAIAAALRHRLPLPRVRPRHIDQVQDEGDAVVTVCDMAREELGGAAAVHWSVPDPVPAGDPAGFDAALSELSRRVERLAPRLAATS
jgi:protein-tyrosine-phosphatase